MHSWKSHFVLRPEEVQALISGKLALRYAGRQVSFVSCPYSSGWFEDYFPVCVNCAFSPFSALSITDRCTEVCSAGQQEQIISRLWKGETTDDAYIGKFKFVIFCFLPKLVSCACPHMKALTEYTKELRDDPIINTHLAKLYDNLLEQNLIRVIEPFSRVQVVHTSET